jgi:hypothetical protein
MGMVTSFELLLGIVLLAASFGGLWVSRPVDGQLKSFARNGRDVYIAIAITVGIGLGISAFVAGVAALMN